MAYLTNRYEYMAVNGTSDGDAGEVSIWLNGADGKHYDGITVLDADDVRGAALLAGNGAENSIVVNNSADVIFQLKNGVGFKADRKSRGWKFA